MKEDHITLKDISTMDGQMSSIDVNDLPEVPLITKPMPWKPFTEEQKDKFCCILDDVNVLNIPRPKSPQEEEELVNKFLDGMRKLFSTDDNWTCLPMLQSSIENCTQCQSCSAACHLWEMSGQNELYRPTYRAEIFRRIYKQYIKKSPLRSGATGTWA